MVPLFQIHLKKIHSLPCNTFWPGLSKFFLEKIGYGQSRYVEVGVLKTMGVERGKWFD